jgi:hypothetical protein
MIKKLVLTAALLAVGNVQAALNTGDIAFTTFNADEDGFAFTTFVDIAANSTVFFTDNEFVSGAFNTGEGQITWSTGTSVINAGSLIRFSAIDKINTAVNFGSFTKSGDTGLNATTENLFAYIGSDINTPTTFLAAISNGNYGSGTGSALISSLVGTGLTVGVNATQLTASSDFAEYTGLRSGLTSFSDYKSLIASNANWNIQGTVDASNTVPNITAFTIAAIPEPETYAMFLAGLGLMAFVSRRKQ